MAERIIAALSASFFYHATLLVPVVLLCTLLHLFGSRTKNFIFDVFGWRGSVLFALIGTPVHELSHALAALIGGHTIRKLELFSPNPSTGTLGEVVISYDRSSLYQSTIGVVIVGLAPLFGGSAVLALLTKYAMPQMLAHAGAPSLTQLIAGGDPIAWVNQASAWVYQTVLLAIYNAPTDRWWFYLYLFAVISVSAHLVPSPDDLRGTGKPLLAILVVSFLAYAVFGGWLGFTKPFDLLLSASLHLQRLLSFALLLTFAVFVVFAVLWLVKRLVFKR